jgi:primosomal protein N' (replication factor Y) (superfamily II helicase)
VPVPLEEEAVNEPANTTKNGPVDELKALVLIGGGMPQAYWYSAGDIPASALSPGTVVEVPLRARSVPGVVVETGAPDLAFALKPILRLAPGDARVPAEWIELLRWISSYYLTPLPLVLQAALPKTATRFLFHPPKRVMKRKQVSTESRGEGTTTLSPTIPQQEAIDRVAASLDASTFKTFLLHGITGSGKTLVYLHLARRTLEQGKRVLVLLPEIALTPQTIGRFEAFLGRKVPAFHSALSDAARRDLWKQLFAGEADIVVGARSAVLAPLENLGLIIVDEEHDGSYKQSDPAPRYHARDLALFRGRQANCPVVLGSATPSLETYQSALAGKHELIELKERATAAPLPTVRLVDMREQLALQGNQLLSIPLRDAVQQALDAGGQAILFLNRRGYSPRRVCNACGEPRTCPYCAVSLVFHRGENELLCHYCGFTAGPDSSCEQCGGAVFTDAGKGVEKVEENLNAIFPGVPIGRLDRDSTAKVGETERILEDFRAGDTRILLGTQMVAKGHDFPKVGVVGVLDADAGLEFADFRAGERAFQLITQVAGRAGRHAIGKESGLVYLQTFRPESPLLNHALTHDYAGFFRAEIETRKELGYPPFRRLLLCEMQGAREGDVRAAMERFAVIVKDLAPQAHAEVLGPAYAALKRIRNAWRLHVLIKGDYPNQLQWLAETAQARMTPELPKGVKLRMDRDPVSLL